jgi:hypothetical protein
MQAMAELAETLLGLSSKPDELILAQVAVRAFLVYGALIVFVRLGKEAVFIASHAFGRHPSYPYWLDSKPWGERYSSILYFDSSVRLVDRPPFRFFRSSPAGLIDFRTGSRETPQSLLRMAASIERQC